MLTERQVQRAILLQDLVLAFVINTAATVLSGGMTDTGAYFAGIFQAFSTNYIAGLILPVETIGRAAAKGLGLREGTAGHRFVRVLVINAIFVTIISFVMALLHCGLSPELFPVWLSTYPALHLTGLLASLAVEKPCQRLAVTFSAPEKQNRKEGAAA